jgi:hypothetical protein
MRLYQVEAAVLVQTVRVTLSPTSLGQPRRRLLTKPESKLLGVHSLGGMDGKRPKVRNVWTSGVLNASIDLSLDLDYRQASTRPNRSVILL